MAVLALLIGMAGCGEAGGVASGATVSAYVAAPLCAEADRELAAAGGRAGDLRLRVVCLPSVERRGRLDLAALGAGARRATEDSSAVAYLGSPNPGAVRFSRPILESAHIAELTSDSGATAMGDLLRALRGAAGAESPREAVRGATAG